MIVDVSAGMWKDVIVVCDFKFLFQNLPARTELSTVDNRLKTLRE